MELIITEISNIPSASACACACRKQTGCAVFTWTHINKVCYLKTAAIERRKSNGAYSGTVHCCTGNAKNKNASKSS